MYGLQFRDGYKKNQRLDKVILTPTTKGDIDEPLTKDDIIKRGYLNFEQTEYIYEKAFELFAFGSIIAQSKGLILVDTKYEFGFCEDNIILIDELHTCDSSRYWCKNSYNMRVSNGQEPEKFDKDCIRDYVRTQYSLEEIESRPNFDIPPNVVKDVEAVYWKYYNILISKISGVNRRMSIESNPELNTPTSNNDYNLDMSLTTFVNYYLNDIHKYLVVIIAGSKSDKPHVYKIINDLKTNNIYSVAYYKSAHKNTKEVLDIIEKYNTQNKNRQIVFVTVAGRSNALSGVVASNTHHPVIACPPFNDKMDCLTNINSTLQCPSKVPVLTCLEPVNVALAIKNIYCLR
jgi:phosphoribosylaminoimidazole carboxylase PurE protein